MAQIEKITHLQLMKCEEEGCGCETYTVYIVNGDKYTGEYKRVCPNCWDIKYRDREVNKNENSRIDKA